MSLYSCDYDSDFDWEYRERIEISDGSVKCCESGIVIPKGQPYAHCQNIWTEECLEEMSDEDKEKLFESTPQCMEVWRLLRRNNHLHGACAPFGCALEFYCNEIEECDRDHTGIHVQRYRELIGVINKAKKRYDSARGPRLHPSEAASLESGAWHQQLKFEHRKKPSAIITKSEGESI